MMNQMVKEPVTCLKDLGISLMNFRTVLIMTRRGLS